MIRHLWRQFVRQSRSSTHWQPNCNVSLVSGTGKNSPAAQFVPFARDRLMRCHRSAAAAVAANVEEEEDRMFYCHCTSVHIANTKRANSLRLATWRYTLMQWMWAESVPITGYNKIAVYKMQPLNGSSICTSALVQLLVTGSHSSNESNWTLNTIAATCACVWPDDTFIYSLAPL